MAKTQIANLNVLLTAQTAQFSRGIKRASKDVRYLQTQVKRSMDRIKYAIGSVAAIMGLGLGIRGFFNELDRMDEINKQARRMGITARELAGLQFAFEQTGTAAELSNKAMQMFMRQVSDAARLGSGTAFDWFEKMKVDPNELRFMTITDQLKAVADGINGLTTESDKMAASMAVFGGRAGRQMLNLMLEGSDAIDAYIAEAKELGAVLDEDAYQGAEQFNDATNRLKTSLRGLAGVLAGTILPRMIAFTDKLTEFVKGMREADFSTARAVLKFAALTAGFVVAVKVIGGVVRAIMAITTAIKAMTKAQTVALAFAGPKGWAMIGAGIAVAAGAAYAVDSAFEAVEESLSDAVASIEDAAQANKEATDEAMAHEAAAEALAARMAELEARAKSVFEATRTEAEKTAAELEELQELFDMGFIDEDTFNRAVSKLTKLGDKVEDVGDSMAAKFEEMERRAKSLIESLMTDNERLQRDIREVQELYAHGFISKAQQDKAIQELIDSASERMATSTDMTQRADFAAMGAERATGRKGNTVEDRRQERIAKSVERGATAQERLLELIQSGELTTEQKIQLINS